MLVYGDGERHEDPRAAEARLAAILARVGALPPGIERHAALAGALVAAGELAQGLADAALAECGAEDAAPGAEAAMALLMHCAGALLASWRTGFAAGLVPAFAPLPGPLPARIGARLAEGFAFYALYPETYALAAAASCLPATTRVIGLRSIGAPLGAMVAAGLGAVPPATLRPGGHPFRREIAVAPGHVPRLLPPPGAPAAVVDEGPGLSGSSFGAAADWLEAKGVAPDRIVFFPGHGGPPGQMASGAHRARWARAARHWLPFEAAVAPRLPAWAADLIGPAEGPMEEIAGGAWRARRFDRKADWPPVHAWQERRKFLLPAAGATWLLKFAGLGREGARKAARARALAEAGFSPPVAGWRHGFLVERWLAEARPLDPARADPARLAARVTDYLAFRARAFPAGLGCGASPAELHAMARHNAREALGEGVARRLDRWTPDDLAALARRVRPVETDNRMQAWEWLAMPDGRLLKSDAVDHHAAHDLVGCQDIAWDVAGAMVELGVAPRVGADPALLDFLLPCYCAFQLGAWTMAADAAPDGAGAARCRAAADRYAARLRKALPA